MVNNWWYLYNTELSSLSEPSQGTRIYRAVRIQSYLHYQNQLRVHGSTGRLEYVEYDSQGQFIVHNFTVLEYLDFSSDFVLIGFIIKSKKFLKKLQDSLLKNEKIHPFIFGWNSSKTGGVEDDKKTTRRQQKDNKKTTRRQ